MNIIRRQSYLPDDLRGNLPISMSKWAPQTILGRIIHRALEYLPIDLREELVDQVRSIMVCEGQLSLRVIRVSGQIEDYGIVSNKVVTSDGVLWIASSMAAVASYDITSMKFHGIGTGTNAEAAADTVLQTELTTQYNPDNTRATGSVATGTSGANQTYTTVGTNTVDSSVSATEHGIFNRAANGARVTATNMLLDRSVFSVISLASGDGIASTYVLTLNSGG